MDHLISKRLSDIVTEKFKTATVFEKYHLDYCCKGKRSLQQACEEQNVSLTEIVNDLNKIYTEEKPIVDFNKLKLSELVDYIVHTHHSYVKKEMPLIIAFLKKVSSKHGERHPELFKISELFTELSVDMLNHMHKEENDLFPAIKQLENAGSGLTATLQMQDYIKPIINLEAEHEQAGSMMAEINAITNTYTPPTDACTTFKLMYASLQAFEIDLHHHVHLENNILFPKALQLQKEIQFTIKN